MRGLKAVLFAASAAIAANAASGASAPAERATSAPLSVAQIVESNVNARGGLVAWRRIRTMVWSGRMESVNAPVPSMSYELEQERPNKTRFELTAMNRRTVRVFNGTQGWKAHPDRNGKLDAQAFDAQDLKFANDAQGIDGPLIDYQAKGNSVALVGQEKLDGRTTYKLDVHLASGGRQNIWVDAQSFLEVRLDRISLSSAGLPGLVTILYHDYKSVEGVKIPMLLEIGAGSGRTPDRMTIERVALNPPLDDADFERPGANLHRRTAAAASPAPGLAPAAHALVSESEAEAK